MRLELKKNYSRLKMFLVMSIIVGIFLCFLLYIGIFSNFDYLLLSLGDASSYTPLPITVMIFIVMFHTVFPGIIILEEGIVKGIIYTVVTWFFYGVLIHSYSSTFELYIPLAAPLLGCIISVIRVLVWEYALLQQEKDGITKTFGSFVEPKVAEMLIKNPDAINQDGVRQNVTIMFADLRGFTKLCEEISPEQVIAMLRDCFGKLITVVHANGGTIDKLIGDSMMVVWGNPIATENHAEKAVESAIAMQAMMVSLQKKWKKKAGVNIMLGIGINTDEVVAGTIGSEEFCDYTVLGSGVNLASRLESVCPGGYICVSKNTYTILEDTYQFKKLGDLKQKNNGGTAEVYRVVG